MLEGQRPWGPGLEELVTGLSEGHWQPEAGSPREQAQGQGSREREGPCDSAGFPEEASQTRENIQGVNMGSRRRHTEPLSPGPFPNVGDKKPIPRGLK